jgi:hypothetical protein
VSGANGQFVGSPTMAPLTRVFLRSAWCPRSDSPRRFTPAKTRLPESRIPDSRNAYHRGHHAGDGPLHVDRAESVILFPSIRMRNGSAFEWGNSVEMAGQERALSLRSALRLRLLRFP